MTRRHTTRSARVHARACMQFEDGATIHSPNPLWFAWKLMAAQASPAKPREGWREVGREVRINSPLFFPLISHLANIQTHKHTSCRHTDRAIHLHFQTAAFHLNPPMPLPLASIPLPHPPNQPSCPSYSSPFPGIAAPRVQWRAIRASLG